METTFMEYQCPYKKNNNMKNFADDDNFIFHHYIFFFNRFQEDFLVPKKSQ